jgi:phage/plasmid-associated DNA primase
MVDHAVAFYAAGRSLSPPTEVAVATADYRKAEDVIGQYLDARVRLDPEGRVKASDLYAAFKAWWVAEGHRQERVPGRKKFGEEAGKRFETKKASGVLYRVRFISDDERERGRKKDTPGGEKPQEEQPGESPERDCGRIEGDFGVSASRDRADSQGTRKTTPILPRSRDTVDGGCGLIALWKEGEDYEEGVIE